MIGFWTDPRTDDLKLLWADQLSASDIAARLNTTRNAVLGKLHRLGLLKDGRKPSKRVGRYIRKTERGTVTRSPRTRTIMRYSPISKAKQAHEIIMVKPPKVEPTKNELRAILRQAVLNTAAMQ